MCCGARIRSLQLPGAMTTPRDRRLGHSTARNRVGPVSDSRPDPSGHAPEPDPTTRSPYSRYGTPAPLAVAAAMTFVEGLLIVLYGISELFSLTGDRLVMGLTTGGFFLVYGGFPLGLARGTPPR